MKRFVEEYPEFQKLGGNVSKHVALVGELSRVVGRDLLMEVGEVEQSLASGSNVDFKVRTFVCVMITPDTGTLQSVQALVNNPSIQPHNKLRLVMLYALRYQKSAANNIATLINALVEHGVTKEEAQVCAQNNQDGALLSLNSLYTPSSICRVLIKDRMTFSRSRIFLLKAGVR